MLFLSILLLAGRLVGVRPANPPRAAVFSRRRAAALDVGLGLRPAGPRNFAGARSLRLVFDKGGDLSAMMRPMLKIEVLTAQQATPWSLLTSYADTDDLDARCLALLAVVEFPPHPRQECRTCARSQSTLRIWRY